MSLPLLELIAFGMALGNKQFRESIGPEMIRDEELRILILSLKRGHHAVLKRWFCRVGVDSDKGGLMKALRDRLTTDADHERTLDAFHEMLLEHRERKEKQEREEAAG
jgi:hypothetical protein